MKRRDFLKAGAATAATLGVVSKSHSAQQDLGDLLKTRTGYPVLQLFTDDQSAQFRVLNDKGRAVTYGAVSAAGVRQPTTIISRTSNPHSVAGNTLDHLFVEGLVPGVKYYLQIHDTQSGELIDSREFAALDIASGRRSTRFAMVSCMHDYMPTQTKMWQSLYEMKPEVILFVGDACYADFDADGSPKAMWRRMFETRQTLDVFYWKRLTPIVATWDDHDFGGDNQNKNNPLKAEALVAFKAMFGSVERPNIVQGPGVSSIVTLFGQRFCMLDGRCFRDPKGPEALHWGEEQENWLFDSLGASTDPVWLMNGSQFFGAYLKKESVESDHPFQLARVLGRLADVPAPVVFGSGDVHFSELMKIEKKHLGYETFEITSSSMHSTTYPTMHRRAVNPRRIQGAVWQHNYVIVETDASVAGKLSFRARSIGMGRALYFDRSFEVVR